MADATGNEIGTGADPQAAEPNARREFLKKIGTAGVAVPAISLLLAANFQPGSAEAGSAPSGNSGSS
jgi:hypothetical protein